MADKPKCETCQAWRCWFPGADLHCDNREGSCYLHPAGICKRANEFCMQHIPIEERGLAGHINPTHASVDTEGNAE